LALILFIVKKDPSKLALVRGLETAKAEIGVSTLVLQIHPQPLKVSGDSCVCYPIRGRLSTFVTAPPFTLQILFCMTVKVFTGSPPETGAVPVASA
jgi:hypothetical protein